MFEYLSQDSGLTDTQVSENTFMYYLPLFYCNGQEATLDETFNGVKMIGIQSFSSSRIVTKPNMKNPNVPKYVHKLRERTYEFISVQWYYYDGKWITTSSSI